MRKKKIIILLTILFIAKVGITLNNHSQEPNWGDSPEEVSQKINLKKKVSLIKINKKSQLNPFLKYITSIDETLSNKIKIFKINGNPDKEFHFINKKLFSITLDYKSIKKAEFRIIKAKYIKKFTKWEKNKNQYGISYLFEDRNSKIIIQLKRDNNKNMRCRIYLYAKKIFRILLKENL